ncbi:MAG TPA: phage tail protein [Hyphomicrobiaceae bacterium]|nr:phage tail protein [Hyphomicrobiaceae bacterium]
MTERVLTAKITRAGMRALFNATNTGVQLDLSHMAIGNGIANAGYTPNGNEVALGGEFARVEIGSGDYLGDYEIMVTGLFSDATAGWANEVGIFTSTGVLFAVWSEPAAPIAYKTANVPFVLALTLALGDVPPGSINIIVGAPSVNIMIVGPFAVISAEIIRLQRRMVESENARLTPIINSTWQ